jgi:putative intracellular protease/amidase
MSTSPRVLIPLSTSGHDPTEVAIPYSVFHAADLTIHFATESGGPFACDSRMLTGVTGALLGADTKAKKAYQAMMRSSDDSPGSVKKPLCWTDPDFSMLSYDLVFLPGGHEKGVRRLIESEEIHRALAIFFPLTKRNGEGTKVVAAICHGVQVLSSTPAPDSAEGKSIIHACTTTALPSFMESSITTLTRPFLGDYYRTYGHGSPTVEEFVTRSLDKAEQFKAGPSMLSGKMGRPFVVVDERFRYISGRFPPDAEAVAQKALEEVRVAKGSW